MMILTTPDFHNVFELAQQLSSEEQNLLAKKLHRTKTQHKTPEVAEFLWWDNTILSSEEQAEAIRRREELEAQCTPEKRKAQDKAWERFQDVFSNISEEEIQAMEDAREEINKCRLASL